MATLGKKGGDHCRDIAVMGRCNVGMYYDTCFLGGGRGVRATVLFKKMLLVLHHKQSISIKQKPKRNRDQRRVVWIWLVWWPFPIKSVVLNSTFVRNWLTGRCREVIWAVGTRFRGRCRSEEVTVVERLIMYHVTFHRYQKKLAIVERWPLQRGGRCRELATVERWPL